MLRLSSSLSGDDEILSRTEFGKENKNGLTLADLGCWNHLRYCNIVNNLRNTLEVMIYSVYEIDM